MMPRWDGGARAGRHDAQRFVDLTAGGPARLFGLWPRKGTIAVRAAARTRRMGPGRETRLSVETLHMRVHDSPYEGRVVRGGPAVVRRGARSSWPWRVERARGPRAVPEARARNGAPRLSAPSLIA